MTRCGNQVRDDVDRQLEIVTNSFINLFDSPLCPQCENDAKRAAEAAGLDYEVNPFRFGTCTVISSAGNPLDERYIVNDASMFRRTRDARAAAKRRKDGGGNILDCKNVKPLMMAVISFDADKMSRYGADESPIRKQGEELTVVITGLCACRHRLVTWMQKHKLNLPTSLRLNPKTYDDSTDSELKSLFKKKNAKLATLYPTSAREAAAATVAGTSKAAQTRENQSRLDALQELKDRRTRAAQSKAQEQQAQERQSEPGSSRRAAHDRDDRDDRPGSGQNGGMPTDPRKKNTPIEPSMSLPPRSSPVSTYTKSTQEINDMLNIIEQSRNMLSPSKEQQGMSGSANRTALTFSPPPVPPGQSRFPPFTPPPKGAPSRFAPPSTSGAGQSRYGPGPSTSSGKHHGAHDSDSGFGTAGGFTSGDEGNHRRGQEYREGVDSPPAFIIAEEEPEEGELMDEDDEDRRSRYADEQPRPARNDEDRRSRNRDEEQRRPAPNDEDRRSRNRDDEQPRPARNDEDRRSRNRDDEQRRPAPNNHNDEDRRSRNRDDVRPQQPSSLPNDEDRRSRNRGQSRPVGDNNDEDEEPPHDVQPQPSAVPDNDEQEPPDYVSTRREPSFRRDDEPDDSDDANATPPATVQRNSVHILLLEKLKKLASKVVATAKTKNEAEKGLDELLQLAYAGDAANILTNVPAIVGKLSRFYDASASTIYELEAEATSAAVVCAVFKEQVLQDFDTRQIIKDLLSNPNVTDSIIHDPTDRSAAFRRQAVSFSVVEDFLSNLTNAPSKEDKKAREELKTLLDSYGNPDFVLESMKAAHDKATFVWPPKIMDAAKAGIHGRYTTGMDKAMLTDKRNVPLKTIQINRKGLALMYVKDGYWVPHDLVIQLITEFPLIPVEEVPANLRKLGSPKFIADEKKCKDFVKIWLHSEMPSECELVNFWKKKQNPVSAPKFGAYEFIILYMARDWVFFVDILRRSGSLIKYDENGQPCGEIEVPMLPREILMAIAKGCIYAFSIVSGQKRSELKNKELIIPEYDVHNAGDFYRCTDPNRWGKNDPFLKLFTPLEELPPNYLALAKALTKPGTSNEEGNGEEPDDYDPAAGRGRGRGGRRGGGRGRGRGSRGGRSSAPTFTLDDPDDEDREAHATTASFSPGVRGGRGRGRARGGRPGVEFSDGYEQDDANGRGGRGGGHGRGRGGPAPQVPPSSTNFSPANNRGGGVRRVDAAFQTPPSMHQPSQQYLSRTTPSSHSGRGGGPSGNQAYGRPTISAPRPPPSREYFTSGDEQQASGYGGENEQQFYDNSRPPPPRDRGTPRAAATASRQRTQEYHQQYSQQYEDDRRDGSRKRRHPGDEEYENDATYHPSDDGYGSRPKVQAGSPAKRPRTDWVSPEPSGNYGRQDDDYDDGQEDHDDPEDDPNPLPWRVHGMVFDGGKKAAVNHFTMELIQGGVNAGEAVQLARQIASGDMRLKDALPRE